MLNYNENKVKAGVAECIHENIFGRSVEDMSFNDKLNGFINYTDRNRRVTSNAVHISLNFHPDEKIPNERAKEIADAYMEKIGFGMQPYLVYRHDDAAHPHLHIVTTNVQHDGKRIAMFNIGRNQSEKARQEIEKDFKLITATGRRQVGDWGKRPKEAEARAVYGKTETKRAINYAVTRALQYKFTSLPEFNAILKQFNVTADRGKEDSFLFSKRGLIFFITDADGVKNGMPMKASSLYNQPTLKNLEALFKKNEVLRLIHRDRVKKCVDAALGPDAQIDRRKFVRAMNREGIFVLFRVNAEAIVYGVTFVDNKSRVVFNGSDLGKAYSAKVIKQRLVEPDFKSYTKPEHQFALDGFELDKVIGDVTTAKQYGSDYDPYVRRRRNKKRRSR